MTTLKQLSLALLLTLVATAPLSADDNPKEPTMENLLGVVHHAEKVDTPRITRLPDGRLLVAYRVLSEKPIRTYVAESTDGGKSWTTVCNLGGNYYGPSMFLHRKALYMFLRGTLPDGDGGFLLFKSTDDGRTWTHTVLIPTKNRKHMRTCGNGAVLVHEGNIIVGASDWGGSGKRFPQPGRIGAGWCPEDADPMKADNWTWTEPLEMPDPNAAPHDKGGWLEAMPVIAPDGTLRLLVRVDSDRGELGAIARVDMDKRTIVFEDRFPAKPGQTGFLRIPGGGCGMFFIRWDPVSTRYLMVSNPRTGGATKLWGIYRIRNCMALFESKDLYTWRWVGAVVRDDQYANWKTSSQKTGFQQPSFVIDGDDLLAVSRTAWGKTKNWHDANYITVHKLAGFRKLIGSTGPVTHFTFDQPKRPSLDTSGQNNHATTVGQVAIDDAGVRGRCAALGKDGYLNLRHRTAMVLHGSSVVTVTCWINNTTPGGTVLDLPIDRTKSGIGIHLMPDGSLRCGGRSRPEDPFGAIRYPFGTTGTWRHLVARFDYEAAEVRVWLDGKPVEGTGKVHFGSKVFTRGLPSLMTVMGTCHNAKRPYTGKLDDVRIYTRKLTDKEIAELSAKPDH